MENRDILTTTSGTRPDYTAEVLAVLRSGDAPKAVMRRLEDYHGSDIADVLPLLKEPERIKFYRACTTELLADVFEHLERDEAADYFGEMDLKKGAAVISGLYTDSAVEILHSVDRERRGLILDLLSEDLRREIQLISSFDEDEIGSRMTTNYIAIREDMTIKRAMSELVRQAEDHDNIATLFVVDEQGEYCGAVDLKDLITARKETPLEEIIVASFPYVYANEQTVDCIERLKDYSENSIPVLNEANKLLGVITSQSLIEVVDDEMGEDYARLAGLTAEEDLNETLPESMKKRMPWLLILLGLGIVVSTVVGAFEKVVAQLTLIMAFQSLILDMAGNVGTQSLAVTIRVLMDENLTFSQKGRLVWKEMRVGLCNGLILGAISFALVGIYILLFKGQTPLFSFAVSGCIGISLMLAMLISSAVGTLIPIFFQRIKVDPAVASGPLITTVNDLVAVVAYYGLSWLLLLNVMHFGA